MESDYAFTRSSVFLYNDPGLLFTKVLVTFLLIGMLIFAGMAWTRIEGFLHHTVFKNVSRRARHMVMVTLTILLECGALWMFYARWGTSLVDTLFMVSMILLCCTWLLPFFVNYNQRLMNLSAKNFLFSKHISDESVHVFKPKMNPFSLGSVIFSVTGLTITIVYYIPYFLQT